MSIVKLALVLLQLVNYLLKEAEKRKLIAEGERRQLQKQKDALNDTIAKAHRAAADVDHSPDSVRNDPRNRD